MFWSSVMQGFAAFLHWEVWLVVAVYALAMLAITLAGGTRALGRRPMVTMAWMFFVLP